MCEMVDPYTSRSARVACSAAIKIQHKKPQERLWGIYRRILSGGLNTKGKGTSKSRDQIHGQVVVAEAPKKIQE